MNQFLLFSSSWPRYRIIQWITPLSLSLSLSLSLLLCIFLDPLLRWRRVLFILVIPPFSSGIVWGRLRDNCPIKCLFHLLGRQVDYWVRSIAWASYSIINVALGRWEHLLMRRPQLLNLGTILVCWVYFY